ncbi:hypothetical protein TTHERM_000556649 (macronuclear) [Tetrahymena thermophila SB210]|uniref:Uncharacterized protein n=1 Tax=Tetrahymena thermophila (strain SB210) TaxID=312017 RepID=W7XHU0_TETTS|nr:hypothetical protein TTHERM_000556649 [Tetrahymena thermophila SB210]EWS72734.1 hypothetical protein TTHERM_000556649 [Tetrahymena thermophila SB210]|eukprot:XP_012654712.1 hypothetical protein TTHERM_000556649 [Tetrahymena thermophila SB210]
MKEIRTRVTKRIPKNSTIAVIYDQSLKQLFSSEIILKEQHSKIIIPDRHNKASLFVCSLNLKGLKQSSKIKQTDRMIIAKKPIELLLGKINEVLTISNSLTNYLTNSQQQYDQSYSLYKQPNLFIIYL